MDLLTLGPTLDVMSPHALFAKVVHHNASLVGSAPDKMISIRLVLASGVEVVGRPVGVDSAENAIVASDSGLSYLSVSTLSVLEILDPDAAASLVTNTPPPPPRSEAGSVIAASSPARSELRVKLEELNERVQRRFRLEVKAEVLDDAAFGDVGKNQFIDFLEMLDAALTEIASEDVGEITIGSLELIMIALAPGELAVKRSGELLLVAVPFSKPFDKTLSARLQTELELNL